MGVEFWLINESAKRVLDAGKIDYLEPGRVYSDGRDLRAAVAASERAGTRPGFPIPPRRNWRDGAGSLDPMARWLDTYGPALAYSDAGDMELHDLWLVDPDHDEETVREGWTLDKLADIAAAEPPLPTLDREPPPAAPDVRPYCSCVHGRIRAATDRGEPEPFFRPDLACMMCDATGLRRPRSSRPS